MAVGFILGLVAGAALLALLLLLFRRSRLAAPATSGAGEGRQVWSSGRFAILLLLALTPTLGLMVFAVQRSPDPSSHPAVGSNLFLQDAQPLAVNAPPVSEVSAAIGSLVDRLQAEPDDPEGWRLLGWSYLQTERYRESAEAYGRAIELRGDEAELRSSYGEALVRAAGGLVTPDALSAFNAALDRDRKDPRARFFIGLHKEQAGDKHAALAAWTAVIRDAPADAPWIADLKMRTAALAQQLGVTADSVPPQFPTISGTPGPTAEDIARAQSMSVEEQRTMINGMVERLAQRLEDDPLDHEGWIKLARSRHMLGQAEAARAAIRHGLQHFAGSPEVLRQIEEAAQRLGIEGNRTN